MGETYRIDKIVANAVHRPAVGSGNDVLPLYTKVDGYSGSEENIESGFASSNYYAEWIKRKESTYNSPRNIRRLFIGRDRVTVQLFVGYVVSGKVQGRKILHTNYYVPAVKLDGKDFKAESIEHIVSGGFQQNIAGNIMKVVAQPLVCSNIEEIYIDPLMIRILLNSNDERILQQVGSGLSSILSTAESGNTAMIKSDVPLAWFNATHASNKFSRLRTVAIATNLDALQDNISDAFDGKRMYEREDTAGQLLRSGVLIASEINSNNSNYMSFNTSTGIYKYDAEVLDSYFEKVKQKFKEEVQKVKSDTAEVKTKTALEETLDELALQRGEKVTAMILRSAASTMQHTDVIQAIEEMTESGKTKYMDMLK